MIRASFVFAAVLSLAWAKPGILSTSLALTPIASLAPVGPDGRVLDTAEVAVAKAEHAAAHANERLKLASEAVRSGGVELQAVVRTPSIVAPLVTSGPVLIPGAPIGPDGRVVDTQEVAVAKATHAAAQVNERITLANEAVRSGGGLVVSRDTILPVLSGNAVLTSVIPGTSVGPDGRVLDTPEVAAAKAAHAAAQVNERINLANEALRSSAAIDSEGTVVPVIGNNLVTRLGPAAPLGADGRVQDTAEVAVAKAAHAAAHINEKLNLANEAVKSADVVAVAGPALAYGRLVY